MNTSGHRCQPGCPSRFRFLYGRWIRGCILRPAQRPVRSDSSMVDEYFPRTINFSNSPSSFRFLYGRWIRAASRTFPLQEICSDSSMVDEYNGNQPTDFRDTHVQIPLWSMNTSVNFNNVVLLASSDSSMVDEYEIWKTFKEGGWWVQIPLWSMNTFLSFLPQFKFSLFRFLYGRWILFPLTLNG